MSNIVVTYFEPFGGRTTNASKEVVSLLNDYRIKELPVSWSKVPELIDEILSNNPDYLFYSGFGYEHLKYNCIRIFFTGECITPDFNECDYAIGFDRLDFGDRYLRFPLFYLYNDICELMESKHLQPIEKIMTVKESVT